MHTTIPEQDAEWTLPNALHRHDCVDTAPEAALEDLARLAAQACQTPMALLSLPGAARQQFAVGFSARGSGGVGGAQDIALRAGTLGSADVLVVPDARDDARFADSPLVSGEPGIRFFAAVALVTADGDTLGRLTVFDTRPRLIDDTQIFALRAVGQQVVTLLELRRRVADLTGVVSDRSRAEAEARWQALHDGLTGLPNRGLFLQRVDEALAQVRAKRKASRGRSRDTIAVLFVDLDRFKKINDTLGHAAGDALLKEVAARFSGCLRPEDTLARLGGDEFTILLPDIGGATSASNVAKMLLRTLSRPVLLGGKELHIGASIGISTFPKDGEDAQTLLKNADIAMYEAKNGGGYQNYLRSLSANGYERLVEESDLRRAIDKGELSLCYQPQIDLATGTVLGVEALARWRHPERGQIPPAHFIALAEQADLIGPLGEWVLRRACEDAALWRREGNSNLRVAVNLSARQLAYPRLAETVAGILRDTGLPGAGLDLELTETSLAAGGESTPHVLSELRDLGIRLFVDDFGTGYSSLAYLRRFSMDALKIDRSFVAGLGQDTPDQALVRAVIEMANALDLLVVAEGVETRAQRDCLRALGCDMVQGYLFSRPVGSDALRELLRPNQPIIETPARQRAA